MALAGQPQYGVVSRSPRHGAGVTEEVSVAQDNDRSAGADLRESVEAADVIAARAQRTYSTSHRVRGQAAWMWPEQLLVPFGDDAGQLRRELTTRNTRCGRAEGKTLCAAATCSRPRPRVAPKAYSVSCLVNPPRHDTEALSHRGIHEEGKAWRV